jgi:RNA polymerase sigma factor (TIGR02999 family)
MAPTSDVARALANWQRGDAAAAQAVFALVYDDLRALARRQLSRLRPGETLAPTALVHESYLRFAERSAPQLVDRDHFLNVAARAMRHVVIDHLRRRNAAKRDAGLRRELQSDVAAPPATAPIDVIALDEALRHLEALDARQARIVELRFFGGLELRDIAEHLRISERSVKRDWQKARAFLHHTLRSRS